MRQLRLVHLTDDGSSLLVETYDGVERFTLPLDPVLRTAVSAPQPPRAAQPARTPAPPTDGELPKPREIQMRVRGGESPEQVAADAGASIDSVLRFAAPVMAGRARIADEARRARARRTSNENQVVLFGEAVDQRFEAHGISAPTVAWDSRRREDGEWVVTASWHGGEATHTAEWVFHRTSRSVTPADETAVDLLSDAPIRPVVPPQPPRPAAHRLREAPPLVPGVVSFPPMPDAFTGPLPMVEEVFDQEAAPEGPRDLPPLRSVVRADEPVDEEFAIDEVPLEEPTDEPPRYETPGYDEQPLPLTLSGEPLAPAPSLRERHSDAERAERARIPAWDDILLGVRRKSD
ncbi:septation protein SepH [uncultured Jatrophihabitans sp.]|uniref:septation protein SepH n=1 Tax=uncultured Jatrophihabitans sp. TaxID=1610747 RepID=UPI0035C9DF11